MKKQKSYELAYKVVCDKLLDKKLIEIENKIKFAGGKVLEKNDEKIKFEVYFFNEKYLIEIPEFSFFREDGGIISLATKILLLHYINNINYDIKLTGDLISYKQIPGAFNYYPVFQKKAIIPLLEKFKSKEDFLKIEEKFKGKRENTGDFSFKFSVLPKVPVTLIFWEGDDEFDASLDFLFDSSIKEILSQEDIVVLSQMLSKRILFA